MIGVIINKFRGDVHLLEPGLKWFEEYTGKRVLGVIPYLPHLNIDSKNRSFKPIYVCLKP